MLSAMHTDNKSDSTDWLKVSANSTLATPDGGGVAPDTTTGMSTDDLGIKSHSCFGTPARRKMRLIVDDKVRHHNKRNVRKRKRAKIGLHWRLPCCGRWGRLVFHRRNQSAFRAVSYCEYLFVRALAVATGSSALAVASVCSNY